MLSSKCSSNVFHLLKKKNVLSVFLCFQNNDSHPKYSPELISYRVDLLLLLWFGFASFGGLLLLLFCFYLFLVLFLLSLPLLVTICQIWWVRHSSFMVILLIWLSWCMIAGEGQNFPIGFFSVFTDSSPPDMKSAISPRSCSSWHLQTRHYRFEYTLG